MLFLKLFFLKIDSTNFNKIYARMQEISVMSLNKYPISLNYFIELLKKVILKANIYLYLMFYYMRHIGTYMTSFGFVTKIKLEISIKLDFLETKSKFRSNIDISCKNYEKGYLSRKRL